MHKYTALNEQCQRHDCTDNVWVITIGRNLRRVQTPYCERHAREFSSTLDDERRYGG